MFIKMCLLGLGIIGLTACQNATLSGLPTTSVPAGLASITKAASWQVTTLAGMGQFGHQDGTGSAARFYHPTGIAVSATGQLYIADRFNQRIRQMDEQGQVKTISGQTGNGFLNGTWAEALFNLPFALAVGNQNQIYVADTNNHAIRVIQKDNKVSTLAGSGDPGSEDGKAGTFNWPGGLALDPQGGLYIADRLNHQIRYLKADGQVAKARLTPATSEPPLNEPIGLARSSEGLLYIADSLNHRIRQLNPTTGELKTLAGNGTAGWQDGAGSTAQFNTPFGVALDNGERLFIVDRGNNRIRMIELKTGVVSTIAGDGTGGLKDGPGAQAQFKVPFGIAFKAPHDLLIADYGNHAIRRLRLNPQE